MKYKGICLDLIKLTVDMAYLIYGYICRREGHKTKRPVYNFHSSAIYPS